MKNRIISLLFVFGLVSGCHAQKQTNENPKPDGKKSYEEFAAAIDRAKWIVPSNIEGLAEKGSPAHNGA